MYNEKLYRYASRQARSSGAGARDDIALGQLIQRNRVRVIRSVLHSSLAVHRLRRLTDGLDGGALATGRVMGLPPSQRDAYREKFRRAMDMLETLDQSEPDPATGEARSPRAAIAQAAEILGEVFFLDRHIDSIATKLEALSSHLGRLEECDPESPPGRQSRIRRIERVAGLPSGKLKDVVRSIRRGRAAVIAARRRLIESHMGLVGAIAKRYAHGGVDFADLVQEGSLGLIKAAERFNPGFGVRFSTYARWWVRREVRATMIEQAPLIRTPLHTVDTQNRLRHMTDVLRRRLERIPSTTEIMAATGLSSKQVRKVASARNQVLFLDSPLLNDPSVRLSDVLPDETLPHPLESILDAERSRRIREALGALTPREERVLRLRFGIEEDQGRTLQQVGDQFGITRERVRQIERKALRKLRASEIIKGLR